jgi:hypothetical protein
MAMLRSAHRSPNKIVEENTAVIRSFFALVVICAGIVTLGADLAQTAYSAVQTAQTIVLPPA